MDIPETDELLPAVDTFQTTIPKPNLFIVGAPKCATTSMHYYLKKHPDIYMSTPKEPFFFGSDLNSHKLRTTRRSEYMSFFEEAENESVIGESSVWYLYSQLAAEEIKRFNPTAKILIMIRNPVDAMYALHSQFLYSGNEPIDDFGEALEQEKIRKKYNRFAESVYFPQGLLYREVFKYAPQIMRFFDTFGRENVKVIRLKSLKNDPEACYKSVLNFIGVKEHELPSFESHNSNCQIKNLILRKIIREIPGKTLGALRKITPVKSCSEIWQTIKPFFVEDFSREPMDTELRQKLLEECEPHIRALNGIIEEDVLDWLKEH